MANINTKNLHNFKTQLRGGGARPNLFEASIPSFPSGVTGAGQLWNEAARKDFRFLCKAAQLPASTVAEIPVPFRGRILKVAGDRTFEPWTVTIMNDEAMQLRTRLEAWARAIQDLGMNYQRADTIANYQATGYVYHYDRQNGANAAYQFEGIWPSNISAIDLAWDSNDTAEEYTVEFQVQYWEPTTDINQPHGRKKKNRNRNRRGRGQNGG